MATPNEDEIFRIARAIGDSEARIAYLEQACVGDQEMLQRLIEIIAAVEDSNSFLEAPPPGFDATSTKEVASSSHAIGNSIGPYIIREKIGEGGMGVVYVAEQTKPVQRKVAIKVIKPGMDTKEVIARFEAERQALAFMEHPNIARVLDAGATESGRSYFVMELVRGIPITEYCDQVKATPRDRLDLFQTVCDAVQHAHQKGIIHRDIKPSNVLITQVGAKPVVKVIDFGLAKATSGQKLTDKTVYTGFMKLMGTPIYMSPEQAGLSGLDIDTRSDVYSLGVLLYELLTGTTPLDKTDIQKQAYEELFRQIREVEPPKPSSRISTLKDAERYTIAQQRGIEPKNLRQMLDGDLDIVVLKALEKDRERRYNTPQDLAADVERFLTDQPVLAVAPSSWYLARKYFRRHRVAILTVAGILASLVAATAFSSWQAVRANNAARIADVAKQNAVESEEIANSALSREQQTARQRRRLLYASDMALAAQLWDSENGDQRKIDELLTAWIPTDESAEDWRDFSWRYQWTRLHKGAAVTAGDTIGATISLDGHLLTATKTGLYRWVESGTRFNQLWNRDMDDVIFSPDHRWAVAKLGDEYELVDIATGKTALSVPHSLYSFSTRGEFLAAWDAGASEAKVWKLPSDGTSPSDEPTLVAPIVVAANVLPNYATRLRLFDDGQSFLLLDYTTHLTAFHAGQEPIKSSSHRSTVDCCAWSPNGQLVASGNGNGKAYLRLRSDLVNQLVIGTHGTTVRRVRFSPDGTRLAIGGDDGTIGIWDVSDLQRLSERTPDEIDALLLEAQRGDSDETVTAPIELADQPKLQKTIKAHLSGRIQSLAFSADGTQLASFAGGVAKLWNLDHVKGSYEVADFGDDDLSGRCGVILEETEKGARVKTIDSAAVVSGEIRVGDTIVGLSDNLQGELTGLRSKNADELIRMVLGPFGSTVRLVVVDENDDRRVVELRRSIKRDPRPMRLCFSSDGKTIAIAGQANGCTTINLETGDSERYRYFGSAVAISPDGRLLAAVNFTEVPVWDLSKDVEDALLDGKVSADPLPILYNQGSLAFSPDGKFLALGTGYPFNSTPRRSDLKVWRVNDWSEIGNPLFQSDRVLSNLVFTPDNAYLVAISHGGVVRLWNTTTWDLEDRTFELGSTSTAMAISTDGRLLATGTFGIGNTLWDFRTGDKLRVMSGTSPWALEFSPDGRTLASGTKHNVILWDVATGRQLRTFHDHSDAVMGVAFSPDGNKLASVGNEGVLRIRKAATLDEIDHDPVTHASMFRLGQMRNREERYAEAEAILKRLLTLLPHGHPDIAKIESEIKVALTGQGKPPDIRRLE